MNIGERIKSKRTELGYTLEEIAKIVGVSRQTIQRYESGIINNIPSDKIELLAFALRTTPAYLMGWEVVRDEEIGDAFYNDMKKDVFSNMRSMFSDSEVTHFENYIQLNGQNMSLVDNYTNKILSIQSMDEELAAAHERTDVEVTTEMHKHDDDIMNDNNF